MVNRYKVDHYDISTRPFALYRWHWGWPSWRVVNSFATEQEATNFYHAIKHLPRKLK